MKEENNQEWFESWFDSPWYHILYQDRDMNEAAQFINNLMNYLNLPESSWLLDAACGSGRHSVHLNKMGFSVLGMDLSEKSIEKARAYENESLKFCVGDLRDFTFGQEFKAVLNLFTSFGYFDSLDQNLAVLNNFRNSIDHDGVLVIDFMNSERTMNTLVRQETKRVDGIDFEISRNVVSDSIVKSVKFEADGKDLMFEEKVSAFTLSDFKELFNQSGFTISDIFGDYFLNGFDAASSPRLILIARPN